MKKLLAILLVLSTALCFAACGNKQDANQGADSSASNGKVQLKILDTEYTDEDYAICVAKENEELLEKINAALAELTEEGTADKIVDKYISGTAHDLKFQENADGKEELHMATNAQFPPYEYYENNEIVGIDAEMAAAIADKLDRKLVIDDMDFDTIITAVQTGKADMGMAGMTVTEERLQNINFSTSYAKGVQVVIVAENSDIASVDDLAGKKIGVQQATTGDIYATDDFGEDNIVRYPNGNLAVEGLKTNKVDCVIIDNEPAKAYVKANEGLKILETSYADEDYAIAFNKKNTDLQKKVNDALKELIEDGSVQKIIDKYIAAE